MIEVEAPRPPTSAAANAPIALARNALHLVLGQAGATVLSLVLTAALGRALGANEFGLLYFLTSSAGLAYVVVEWGQTAYVVREIARFPEKTGTLLGSALAMRAGGAALGAAGVVGITHLLGYDGRVRLLVLAMMAATLPGFLSQGIALALRGRERMDLDAVVTVAGKALALGFTIPALLLAGGLPSALAAQAAAGAGTLAVAALLLRRLGAARLEVTRATLRELAIGGVPLVAMSVATWAQVYLDAVLLSKLAPAAAMGWYAAARNFMNALTMPASILGTAAYPRLSRAASAPPAVFQAELRTALRPTLGLGALGVVGTFVFADLAVNVVYGGRGYGPAADVLRVFAPALLVFFVDMLFGTAIMALGLPRMLAAAKALNVALSTCLGIVLIPICDARFGNGGLGVVAAFGTSEIVMLVAAVAILPRRVVDRGVLGDLGRAALVAGVPVLAGALLPGPALPRLAAAFAAFLVLAPAMGLVRRSDLVLLRALVSRRVVEGSEGAPGERA